MVRHLAVAAEAAEPAVGQVEMDLFTQAALRAQAHAVADDPHAHHQLGIDRRAANGAIKRLQGIADALQVKKAVNAAQQVIGRDMVVEAEVVEELRRSHLQAHRRPALRTATGEWKHARTAQSMPG
jgi:hypothetical protein